MGLGDEEAGASQGALELSEREARGLTEEMGKLLAFSVGNGELSVAPPALDPDIDKRGFSRQILPHAFDQFGAQLSAELEYSTNNGFLTGMTVAYSGRQPEFISFARDIDNNKWTVKKAEKWTGEGATSSIPNPAGRAKDILGNLNKLVKNPSTSSTNIHTPLR